MSADHCDAEIYVKPETGATLVLNLRNEHTGQWGDFEWYSTSDPEGAKFYTSNTGTRSVVSVSGAGGFSAGEMLYYYGRATGFGWTTVYSSSHSCGGINRLVVMAGDPATGGDSGAPWFVENQAVGIHSGGCIVSGMWRSVFSKAAHVDDAMGVTIKKDL